MIGQLGKLLGLSIDARDPLPQLWEVIRELGERQRRRRSRSARSRSAALLVLRLLRAEAARGADRRRRRDRRSRGRSTSPRTASRSSARFPSGLPSFDAADARASATSSSLLPAALGIFLVSFADEILTARSFAGKHNQHVRASQELLAMGAANAAAGFTQGFSIGASGSRTAVNDAMGARSQIAGLVAAATVARDPRSSSPSRCSTCRRPCSAR